MLDLWREFVLSEFRQWEKEFPDKFADMIYKVYNLKRKGVKSFRHPQFFGWFTRKYIYHPLANSSGAVLDMLDEANPVVYAGGTRKYKLHQFLTEQVGLPALRQHLWQVIGIGNSARDKTEFERMFYRAFPEAIPKQAQTSSTFLTNSKNVLDVKHDGHIMLGMKNSPVDRARILHLLCEGMVNPRHLPHNRRRKNTVAQALGRCWKGRLHGLS